ncbi:hypothetical protein [Neoaquamicrobium sediminum]|uniref:Uncharacterized protein n=1 Tax=Neoaquamicrobium sediminum TaxID=1849104 RepID=A0ABV3X023_9HYPH
MTLLVWLFYFQLLLSGYRHRLRPKILITRGGARTIGARCIITNMSVEAIYLEAIMVSVRDGERQYISSLSELEAEQTTKSDPRQLYLQGPLASGEMIDIGSYAELLKRATNGKEQPSAFTLTVIATYTSEETLVAAERDFTISGSSLNSDAIVARQIRSRWQRMRLMRLISGEL